MEPAPTPPEWMSAEPPLVLEAYYLTRLNLGFTAPEIEDTISQVRSSFGYEIALHNEDDLRWQLIFRVKTQELNSDEVSVGRSVDAEIVAHFLFTKDLGVEKKNFQIRVGGVSIVYGLLRGIVSSATALFPGGPFLLPTIMPQKIVAMVEGDLKKARDLAESAKKKESPIAETPASSAH